MLDEDRKKIEEIMGGLQCPKNFKCAESGFKHLCKATDIGIDSYLKCLEETHSVCSFKFFFGDGHLCQCPLRVYLSRKLKK